MIVVYSGRAGSNTITVEHIDAGKEARRRAREAAQKAGATRKVGTGKRKVKRAKNLKNREEY
jgi:hypothetical protein